MTKEEIIEMAKNRYLAEKKNDIEESNKIIAEFMEVAEYSMNSYLYPEFAYNTLSEDKEHILQEVFGENELKYHCSWDWIMPVIEKIDQIGACVIIGRFFCDIGYTDPLNQEKHFDVRIASGVKINAVNGAVVEFIKWYNNEKAKEQ